MPSDPSHPVPPAFFGLEAREVESAVVAAGWPRFRAGQLVDWVHKKNVFDPRAMTNFSVPDRARLADLFRFLTATITRDQESEDGTRKLLLAWHPPTGPGPVPSNGAADAPLPTAVQASDIVAETVMIPDADRRTACVSSQVGCPVGCRFCASGVNGMKGNLTADQIVEQVVTFNSLMRGRVDAAGRPERITNVVFMGMGEPLANYNAVMKAIRVLHDPKGLNMGARRITISTVGVPSRMRDLAAEELPINLAISLHAPTEPLRRQLIPWAEHFAIDEILDAARFYFDRTGREITLEYILLAGVNDQPEQARELARVCKTLRANVNLIRYNEVTGLPFGRPKAEDVVNFQNILRHNGVNAHVRKSRGRDIDAACGQLRRKTEMGGELVTIGTK